MKWMCRLCVAALLLPAAVLGFAQSRALADETTAACRSANTPPHVRLAACGTLFRRTEKADARALALVYRGSARLDQGELALALADFDKAIALNGHSAIAFNARGVVHHRTQRLRAAIADYTTAIGLDIDYPEALRNRAYAWLANGELDRAERDFATVIELRADSARGFADRGRVRYLRGNYWAAYQDLLRALRLDPADGQTVLWISLSLRHLTADGESGAPLPEIAVDLDDWPKLLLSMLAGEADVTMAVRAALASSADLQDQRLSEAHYFAGQLAELGGNPAEAAIQYRSALGSGIPVRLEAVAAALALRRLERLRSTGVAQ